MSKLVSQDSYNRLRGGEPCAHFERARLRAATKVHTELRRFLWSVGEDLVKKEEESNGGDSIIKMKSQDVSERLTGSGGFSLTKLGFMKLFYMRYSPPNKFYPQFVDESNHEKAKELLLALGVIENKEERGDMACIGEYKLVD